MCGRFTLTADTFAILDMFGLSSIFELKASYNIAPTQAIASVRVSAEGEREAVPMRWGLIPFWAKDKKIGARMINARGESLADKPSFRTAYKRRRCLIPADGWYEWQKPAEGSSKKTPKQPYHIRRPQSEVVAFAGLWEQWTDKDNGELVESCTIITTEACEALAHIHHRMPVVLEPEFWPPWLDPSLRDTSSLQPLLRPTDDDYFVAVPVSTHVNSVRNNDPTCVERVPQAQTLF